MPALARKITPDQDDHRPVAPRRAAKPSSHKVSSHKVSSKSPHKAAAKTSPRTRWHEDKPAERAQSAQENIEAAPVSPEVYELLSHFGHGEATHEATAREHLEARRAARRRARLSHRPFRMTLTAGVLGAAPLCLLASLLWLRSSALAMSRQDSKLQNQISAARFDLESTRKEIASLNASPHLDEWASERHWRRATQKDFDQVPVTSASQPTDNTENSEPNDE